MSTKPEIFYIHDPMCSWCWGFTRTTRELFESLANSVVVHRILGGLAADDALPMSNAMQNNIQENWRRIERDISGVKFNFDFWQNCQPRRSTYPACRAVISARKQGLQYDELMTEKIQHAYYKEARNPSETETLIKLADELDLNVDEFTEDLSSISTEKTLQNEMGLARNLHVDSYPSLVFKQGDYVCPIQIDYNDATSMRVSIESCLEMNNV